MRKILPVIFTLLILCACVSEKSDTVTVYRVLQDEYQTNGEMLIPVEKVRENGENAEKTVIRAMGIQSSDNRAYNPLYGIEILSFTHADGTGIIELGEGYNALDNFSKTLANASLTLSLCSLPDIDRLNIVVSGAVVEEDLVKTDMLLYSDEFSSEQEICIYFANESNTLLIAEYRRLSLDSDSQIERYIVSELLQQQSNTGLYSPIPEGTRLLGVSRNGSTCIINLSKEFLENKPETATEEILAVYSIVNSLTSLSTVSEVKITVEGEEIDQYVNLSLKIPLRQLDLIFLKNMQNSVETRLYFGCKDAIFGVPCIVSSEIDPVQAVLDKLMSSDDFSCYETLFNEEDSLKLVRVGHGVCTVSVSRSFFDRRTSANSALALDALIRTLIELDGISSVMITYPDGTVPLAPYRDLSEAQRVVTAEIIH